MASQPFDRFDVTVLVRDSRHGDARGGAVWRRGAAGGDRLAYPASCVKLGYLVAAVHWCAEQGRSAECLDADVRPMIVESDNVATGRVVDAISGVQNATGTVTEPAFETWLERRRYTERVLEGHGLLGQQKLLTKTYPTNSGEAPTGFEQRALEVHGRNAMSADLAAALMLGIVSGRVEPQATSYMRSLLARKRFTDQGSLAAGTPPGTRVENKIGVAFDTLEDIAWLRLPDGRELVIAAFSNGWDQREPEPWDVLRLGGFTAALLDRLGSARTSRLLQPHQPTANTWRLRAPRAGRYELALWYVATPGNTAQARYRIEGGPVSQTVVFDQRIWGARWLPLAELELRRGATLAVRADALAPGTLSAGQIRFAYVPPES